MAFFVLFIILTAAIFIYFSITTRLQHLESHLSPNTPQNLTQQLRFIEYYISQLAYNITGDPNTLYNYYNLWKSQKPVKENILDWKEQID